MIDECLKIIEHSEKSISIAQDCIECSSMVTISSPTYLIKNGNQFAVLISRTNSIEGNRFYFVASNSSGTITPPPSGARYGNIYATRAEAIANRPAGWSEVNPATPTNLSIALSVAVFQDCNIGVYGGSSPWTLQWSIDGGANWNNGETLTTLRPNTPDGATQNADGELRIVVTQTGTYSFRVLSAGLTSNVINVFLLVSGDGGGGGVTPPSGERILMAGYLHFISVSNYIQMIDEYMARGFNAIYINNLPLDHYFLTWTDFQNNNEFINSTLEFSGKAWDNWLLPILTHIRNTYPTVPVMIKHMANMSPWPALQNNPENVGKDPWWPASESVSDQFGFIANNQGSGIRRSPSFASGTAKNRIPQYANWINARIQSVLNPGQVKWFSWGTANTVELGWSQNATSFSNDGEQQAALRFFHGDYCDAAVLSYRNYLQIKYGTIAAVNAAHGSAWVNFNEVSPPTAPISPPSTTVPSDDASPFYQVYQGTRGQDWGQSRIRDMIQFIEALPVYPGAERILEPGHFAYSFSHMTFGGAPKLLRQRLGKIKTAIAVSDAYENKDIHSDMYASHLQQASWTECAIFDIRREATQLGVTMQTLLNAYVTRQEQVGCEYFLSINSPQEENYAVFRDYWNTTRSAQFKSGAIVSNPDTSGWPVVNVNFAEWSTIQNILNDRWINAGGNNATRIKVNYSEPQITGI
jgi:hypothetical protein